MIDYDDYRDAIEDAAEEITTEFTAFYVYKKGWILEEPGSDEYVCMRCLEDCNVDIAHEEPSEHYPGHFQSFSECCKCEYVRKDFVFDDQCEGDFPVPTRVDSDAKELFFDELGCRFFTYYRRIGDSLAKFTNKQKRDGLFSAEDYDSIPWHKVHHVIGENGRRIDCVGHYAEQYVEIWGGEL